MSKIYVSKRKQVYKKLEESEKEYYDNIERGLASKTEYEDALSRLEYYLYKVFSNKGCIVR